MQRRLNGERTLAKVVKVSEGEEDRSSSSAVKMQDAGLAAHAAFSTKGLAPLSGACAAKAGAVDLCAVMLELFFGDIAKVQSREQRFFN